MVDEKAIIVDIDGTLSNPNHRRHYVEGGDKDWENFFDEVDKDPLNIWCDKLILKFSWDFKIILVTGRPEKSKSGIDVRSKTEAWLDKQGVSYDRLVMRKQGDFRKDTVVKQELLDKELPEPEDILFAVDDRTDIAKMWRSNGITCLQCKDEVEE